MANHEDVYVARLRGGVAAWNEWRALVYEREQQWYERYERKPGPGPGVLVSPMKFHLRGADLRETDLRGADLREMDLREADLRGADCRNADLRQAMLIDSLLDRTNLTGAKLWETQRDGWSIKDVICEGVFWDRECNERTEYGIGDFERIFAEKPRIELRYPGGISPVDLTMLPLIIDRLQAEHPDCALHIRSLNDAGSGALVTITVDDLAGRDAKTFRGEVVRLQTELRYVEGQRDLLIDQFMPIFRDIVAKAGQTIIGQIYGATIWMRLRRQSGWRFSVAAD